MSGPSEERRHRFARLLFSDATLTRKAYLNAFASFLEYGARLLVMLLITPVMVTGLGSVAYGMWQILIRSVGYLSPASGRPTEALKWTLASRQSSDDVVEKRRYVGSALAVWIAFLPLTLVLGAVLVWFLPGWFDVAAADTGPVRAAAAILIVNLALTSLFVIPRSVLQGQNLGYKRMGASAVIVILGGGFTWLALALDTGLPGVAVAGLATAVVDGVFFYYVARRFATWFGVDIPPWRETLGFLKLSSWFMTWNLVMKVILLSDVLIVGAFQSVALVSTYTLSKYAPEMTTALIEMVVFAITPGLGGIVGAREFGRARDIRGEVMAMTWLLSTSICATVLVWNRAFIGLWVGDEFYIGPLASLLLVTMILQLVIIRNDSNMIDLTLKLPKKVLLGVASSAISVAAAIALVAWFDMGVSGMLLGLISGRVILSLAYPAIIGRTLSFPLKEQISGTVRPLGATMALFVGAALLDRTGGLDSTAVVGGWFGFFPLAGLTFAGIVAVCGLVGLDGRQRRRIVRRVRSVLSD